MDKLKLWFYDNRVEITWFLIGFLVMDGLHSFGRGDYTGAFFSWALAFLNYKLN
jgi:hypothetical protein